MDSELFSIALWLVTGGVTLVGLTVLAKGLGIIQ
jgi:hypothetical protein